MAQAYEKRVIPNVTVGGVINLVKPTAYDNDPKNPKSWSLMVSTKDQNEAKKWDEDYSLKITYSEKYEAYHTVLSQSEKTRDDVMLPRPVVIDKYRRQLTDEEIATIGAGSVVNLKLQYRPSKSPLAYKKLAKDLLVVQVMKLEERQNDDLLDGLAGEDGEPEQPIGESRPPSPEQPGNVANDDDDDLY